jgi:hypothetical protein
VSVSGTIAISTPVSYRVFQSTSDGTTAGTPGGTGGPVRCTGTYTGSPTAIEIAFSWHNGGAFQTLDAAPAGGTFDETVDGVSRGQGTVTVRFANATGITATKTFVGVGDVFAVAGQSNAGGEGDNNQSYLHPTLKAGKYTPTGSSWAELTDPVTLSQQGSVWPLMATHLMAWLGYPVAFVSVAVDATASSSWVPGQANYIALTNAITAVGGVRAVLWWQGESDALQFISAATYQGRIEDITDDLVSNFPGIKFMPCLLQNSSGIPNVDEAKIRTGTQDAIDAHADIVQGPDLSDLASDDAYHLTTNGSLATAGSRWALAFYEAFEDDAPPAGELRARARSLVGIG